jgi:hypothetical protein
MSDDMLSPQSLSIEQPRRDRITAISRAVQRRPIVLALGMQRSGTSLCSHILSALGVDMADNIAGPGNASVTPDNPRGHWERWEVVEFHDRILGLFNRDYLGRFHDFALPVAWWADPRVAQIRREIVAFLERRMGDGYFGFKDPRTVRLMPLWHQIFNELKLAPKIVLCSRNPAQVARSLHAREDLDPANGEYRWLVYMIDFYRYTSNLDCCAVEYEEWFNNPAANIEKLRKFLDLSWQQSEIDLALLLSDLVDPTARHDDPGHLEASQPLVRTLYRLAGPAGQDTAARDQIAYIVSQFVSFQQLQRPLLQAFEDVAKTAAKFPEIEQEVAALRAVVGDRDANLAAADARAAAAEGGLAEAQAEIERQRGQIAELTGECEEASGLKAALADRETAVTELSHRADELLSALQAAQAELATREAALRRAEQETQERGGAALAMEREITTSRIALVQAESHKAAAERLQSEIAGLREMFARAERQAQQRAAAVQALEVAIAGLRGRLAQAEREVQERTTAAKAMHAEIVALHDTLTATRQVGQAAIAALRIDTKALTELDGPRSWRRQPIMRLLGVWTLF